MHKESPYFLRPLMAAVQMMCARIGKVTGQEELDKLFAACNEQERLWFDFFLMTGMREQEVMHCSWEDVNLSRSTVTVRYKPEYGFSPKNYASGRFPFLPSS